MKLDYKNILKESVAFPILILFFLFLGCTEGINPLEYAEPYLDNKTINECAEGKTIKTYLVNDKEEKIDVTIMTDSAQFCWVKYTYDGFNYQSGYDKSLGKLCRYKATAPGFTKSNSAVCFLNAQNKT